LTIHTGVTAPERSSSALFHINLIQTEVRVVDQIFKQKLFEKKICVFYLIQAACKNNFDENK
jgi:hypothetical protein